MAAADAKAGTKRESDKGRVEGREFVFCAIQNILFPLWLLGRPTASSVVKPRKTDKVEALKGARAVALLQGCHGCHVHKLVQHQEVQHFVNAASSAHPSE
jgi:hypothetical protein